MEATSGVLSEQEYRKISSRPLMRHNDMSAELCNETVEIITMACDKHIPNKNYEAAAQLIKQSMDKKFGTFCRKFHRYFLRYVPCFRH